MGKPKKENHMGKFLYRLNKRHFCLLFVCLMMMHVISIVKILYALIENKLFSNPDVIYLLYN